jgi:hypothetical protein
MLEFGWIGLVLAIVAAWFVIKVVKFVFKLFWIGALLVGAYWFIAPILELPRPF